MSGLKTWAWTAVIAVATASPAFAQLTSTTIGGTGATGGTRTTTGTGGINSGGGATTGGFGSGGMNGGFGSGGAGGGGNLQTQLATMESAPVLSALTGTTSTSLDPVLGRYYGNPYYQGKDHTAKNVAPGGFGTVLYTSTSNRGTGSITGGRAGATGALGGRGVQNAANQSGILIPLPVQINYTAQMQFATPPIPASRMQVDLRGVVDSGGLSNSKNVEIVIMANNNVRLRGTVKDDEEARLVEGLVRLTPGVGNITNELTFPVAIK